MSASKHAAVANRILSMLPLAEYRRLSPNLEEVALGADTVLFSPGDRVRHVYFPNDAVVSLLFAVDARRTVEVAMEGNESAVGLAASLGGGRAHSVSVVRDAGTALRVEVAALARLAGRHPRLGELLHRSVHALVTQIAQAGICGRYHAVDVRLARWLLMTQDRVGSNELHATQASIARMLGVRRSGITAAASGFHRDNVIDYRRGRIEILDRRRLRAASCACYAIIKRGYDAFLA